MRMEMNVEMWKGHGVLNVDGNGVVMWLSMGLDIGYAGAKKKKIRIGPLECFLVIINFSVSNKNFD